MLRFWSKVAFTESCWLWMATKFSPGYGSFKLHGKMVSAHRIAYEICNGPIPSGLELDHLCRVRNCVNPTHLEPVTKSENRKRASPFRQMGPKLSKDDSEQIVWEYFILKESQERLAIRYNVSNQLISKIVNNKRWPE